VIQGRCGASLATEAFKGFSIFRKVVGKEFQDHEATKFAVLGLVHHAHPAATESFNDAVVGDGLPKEWLRVRHGAVILGCNRERQLGGKLGGVLGSISERDESPANKVVERAPGAETSLHRARSPALLDPDRLESHGPNIATMAGRRNLSRD
jgi:hypothetical protein